MVRVSALDLAQLTNAQQQRETPGKVLRLPVLQLSPPPPSDATALDASGSHTEINMKNKSYEGWGGAGGLPTGSELELWCTRSNTTATASLPSQSDSLSLAQANADLGGGYSHSGTMVSRFDAPRTPSPVLSGGVSARLQQESENLNLPPPLSFSPPMDYSNGYEDSELAALNGTMVEPSPTATAEALTADKILDLLLSSDQGLNAADTVSLLGQVGFTTNSSLPLCLCICLFIFLSLLFLVLPTHRRIICLLRYL